MKHQGFTMIELVIAVAILGILAAIAVPAYQAYTIRSKMSEVFIFATNAEQAVNEYYLTNHAFPTANDQAGLATNITGQYVTNVEVVVPTPGGSNGNPFIRVTFSIPGLSTSYPNDLRFLVTVNSDDTLIWKCTALGQSGAYRMDPTYIPTACQ